MKEITLAVIVISIVGTSGFLIKIPSKIMQPEHDISGYIHMQKMMLPLFENICEESSDPVITKLAQEFSLENIEDYTNPNVITDLQNLQSEKGLLSKNQIFTEFNSEHRNELKIIYSVMLHAKNFDTFFKVAAWARQNTNCGLFIDAIYLAILTRHDLSRLSLPAPYELLPNYFIRKDIIIKASSLLTDTNITLNEYVKDEGNAYILDANYTADINDEDDDSKLAYFREDIALNSFYFFRKLRNTFWSSTNSNLNNRYGEYIYESIKQLVARYDLERYSNGLPELESLNWDSTVNSYDPMLIYSTGVNFAHRTATYELPSVSDGIEFLQNIDANIADVVTHLKQTGYNKTQIINHLVEIFITGDKSYETLSRKCLGYDRPNEIRQYSVLDHILTSLRDPVFWKLNKKIVELIDNSIKAFPGYSRNELYFPGVEILNIETKKMITQFDDFQFDVTNSLKSKVTNKSFQVKISQPRLNHKPFVIKVNISSFVAQKGLLKIYLGPKMLPGEYASNKNSFVLLDSHEISLKKGINLISRSSNEMKRYSSDFTPLRFLIKRIEDAEFGLETLPLKAIDTQIGYPDRLILPKGSANGLPLQIFVFIAPLSKIMSRNSFSTINNKFNTAILSPGYPFDLSVDDYQLFSLPNAMTKEILIAHKDNKQNYNGGDNNRKWEAKKNNNYYNKDYSEHREDEEIMNNNNPDNTESSTHGMLNLRPEFTKRKQPADYSSKRGQYGQKNIKSYNINNSENKNQIEENNVKTNKNTFGKNPNYEQKDIFDYRSKKNMYDNKTHLPKKYNDYKNNDSVNKFISEVNNTDFSTEILNQDVMENGTQITDIISRDTDKSTDELFNEINYKNDVVDTSSNILEEPQSSMWNLFDYILHSFDVTNPEKMYELS